MNYPEIEKSRKRKGFIPYIDGDIAVMTDGKYGKAFIDVEDFDLANKYIWGTHNVRGNVYARAKQTAGSSTSYITLHRLVTGLPPFYVDHINGNTLDNRKCNLRPTTSLGNYHGFRRGVSGVFYNPRKDRFKTAITVNNKNYYLGSFETEMAASNIYRRVNEIVADVIALKVEKELSAMKGSL